MIIDDKKRFAGFPSLAGTARLIAKLIPRCSYYVEPFAGTAKVYQELVKKSYFKDSYCDPILNDRSGFIRGWLRKEFPSALVTADDFIDCVIMWDSEYSFFLFDQPWNESFYDQSFSYFNRESVADYDREILELCEKMKGKFIITTRKENKRMIDSRFPNKLIRSEYILSGRYPKVMITTNLRLD